VGWDNAMGRKESSGGPTPEKIEFLIEKERFEALSDTKLWFISP
jgi:hypothetical protein